MPVADTLLRIASEPAFFTPRWSKDILDEVHRTLLKFGYQTEQADRRISAMMENFPDALVEGYEPLVPSLGNDPQDRHVLAAAVKCNAHAVVTNNKKHF